MLKNLFFIAIPLFFYGQVISPTNPFTKNYIPPIHKPVANAANYSQSIQPKLNDIKQSFDSYWKDKNPDKKGSGHKPFMRWFNHWEDYLLEDGTIAPPAVLWEAWEKKKKNEFLNNNQSGVPIPVWSNIGPAIVSNTAITTSGQGRLNTIIKDPIDPQTIYVGAPAGGLWKSIDDGLNWSPLTDYLPQIGVSGIAIDPSDNNIIYIATGDDDAGDSYSVGVMKSLDAGLTWNSTGLQYSWTNYKTTNEIFIDPIDNNTIWVASTDGLQKSTDGGDSWTIKLSGNIVDFRFKPIDVDNIASGIFTIYAVGYDDGGNSRFYKSIDSGESFSIIPSIPDNSNRIILEVTKAAPEKVYVLSAYDNGDGTYEGQNSFQGLYVSDNSGSDFTKTAESDDIFQSGQSWYDMALTVADNDPNIVFVGVLDIWKSIDGGNDFTQLNKWWQRNASFTHADIHFLRYFDGDLYAGTDGGIYRSYDDGNNFQDLSNTLSISQIYSVATSKPNSSKLASGLQDCGGFAFSEGIWNSYHGGDGMGTAVDPFNEDTYYGFTQYGGNLSVTTNGGQSSNMYIASGPVKGQWETPLQFAKNGELYSGFDQLYILNNNNWDVVSNHSFGHTLRHLEMDPNNTNIIYAATYNEVFKSNDRGKTFELILTTDYYYIRDIEVHNTDSNTLWVISSQELFKSSDGGANFINLSSDLPSEANRSLVHQPYSDNDALYLGTLLGVYYKDNSLNDWISISQNLPNVKVSDMEINSNDNILTISTYGRGIWQTPIPEVNKPTFDLDLVDLKLNVNDSFYSCDNNANYQLKIYNNGTQTVNNFTYAQEINGINNVIEWSGSLEPGSVEIINNSLGVGLNLNNNSLNINLINPEDTIESNNLLSLSFDISPNNEGIENSLYTFNESNENWRFLGDLLWEKGISTKQGFQSANPNNSSYVTGLDENYANNINSELISPCFDLSMLETASVKFSMAYDIEQNYDYLYFDYSTDSGQNWNNLQTFTGTNLSFTEYSYEIQNSSTINNVIFRFNFESDNIENREGAIIDNFIIEGSTLSNKFSEYEYVNIYPNPNDGVFSIGIDNSNFNVEKITILSIDGKIVYESEPRYESLNFISLEDKPAGLYFVEITTLKQKLIKKIIKR